MHRIHKKMTHMRIPNTLNPQKESYERLQNEKSHDTENIIVSSYVMLLSCTVVETDVMLLRHMNQIES